MTEPSLFDMEPVPLPDPGPKLSDGRRRTIRQAQALANGRHPLGLVHGTPLRLHPDAPPAGDRKAPGPRCGSCVFIERQDQWLKCTRGRAGEIFTRSFRRGPYETRGAATDLRAWWPACEKWEERADE
jgi:hypothetical protein